MRTPSHLWRQGRRKTSELNGFALRAEGRFHAIGAYLFRFATGAQKMRRPIQFACAIALVAGCSRTEPEPLRIAVIPWPGLRLFFLAGAIERL